MTKKLVNAAGRRRVARASCARSVPACGTWPARSTSISSTPGFASPAISVPRTKMPQFFGLYDHLDGEGLEESQQFEPIEIRGVTEYLLAKSQPFEFTAPPKSVTAEGLGRARQEAVRDARLPGLPSAQRFPGRQDDPRARPVADRRQARPQATIPTAGKWLYTWLRNPSKYHPRTLMPNLILDPIAGADGKLTDPAADIAAFLLGSQQDWEPTDVPARELTSDEREALERSGAGAPEDRLPAQAGRGLSGDRHSREPPQRAQGGRSRAGRRDVDREASCSYVGRRTISKYGCSGCHDMPGFEDAKPIGTGLADWARKTPDKLAFEQIVEYMKHGHGTPGALEPRHPTRRRDATTRSKRPTRAPTATRTSTSRTCDPDTGYFMEKLFGHQREGFIWQKLREPRSYDYQEDREQGLQRTAADAASSRRSTTPSAKRSSRSCWAWWPSRRRRSTSIKADAAPRGDRRKACEVIEKFNCTGCHTLEHGALEVGLRAGRLRRSAGRSPIIRSCSRTSRRSRSRLRWRPTPAACGTPR